MAGKSSLKSLPSRSSGIGPNAVLQVLDLAERWYGSDTAKALSQGLFSLDDRPTCLVNESLVAKLHQRVALELEPNEAYRLLHHAGEQTANYLLEHRIPRPAQWLMKRLPSVWASYVLTAAITKNAWTFVGSGQFSAFYKDCESKPKTKYWVYRINENPLAKGQSQATVGCWFYAAVFQRLFQVLVHPATRVVEAQCMGRGDPYCEFELRKA